MHVEHADPVTPDSLADGGLGAEALAERALAEYLRLWGLRDPSAIAERSRLWVRRAVSLETCLGESLTRAALAEALGEVDRWLDHLARLVSPDAAEAAARRGLLALEVQAVIDNYPGAFLRYEALPESLLQRLRAAARPVVPAESERARMDGPPLGELPPLLQPQRWRHFFGRLATALRGGAGREGRAGS